MKPVTIRRAAALAFWTCAAAVLWLALAPPGDAPPLVWDKAKHLVAFAVLCALGLGAWPARHLRLAAALLAYGIAIEGLQALTPARQADGWDVLADAAGIALGWSLVAMAARLRGRAVSGGGP